MGLLSRQRPRPAAAPGLWRRGDFLVTPLGGDLVAVQRRGRAVLRAPAFLTEFVHECVEFRPLELAVERHADRHGWDPLQSAALRELLPWATAEGLLVSTESLRAAQTPGASAPPSISSLGLSTGGDRLAFLERGLRSFAENLRTHGRTVSVLVSENSAEPAQAARCREALGAWSRDFPELRFQFAAAGEKRAFAARLSRAGACAPEVAEFALLDPLGTGFSVGANRNALLLQSAGEMLASLDDDAICRLASPPQPRTGLSCVSDTDPYARWLAGSRAGSLHGLAWPETDYLGAHEQLLGRSAGELFAAGGEIDFARTRDGLTRRLRHGPAQVRASYTGHVGDPGLPTSAYYLYYHGENRERLVATPEHYRSVFGSRSVLSVSAGTALGDATVCPGIAMAVDGRELLPPFFPVLHAEDYAWGALLWRTDGGALLGHLPLAVYHEPGEGKAILTPKQLQTGPPFVLFEFAHLLRQVVLRASLPESGSDAGRLRALGRHFAEAAALPELDFREYLRGQALLQASERVEYLLYELENHPELPGYWREDVEALIAHLQSSVETPAFEVPLDLLAVPEPQRLMQTLFARFGALLQAWPDMVEAARCDRTLMPALEPAQKTLTRV